ncbi:MAG: hypothetical protein CFH21_00057 [Alphaproteobacteria bacterium MarineAlpha5_Bin11]|nr:MAG: hypothetical protein CFH21_00057 [Alphaproteobacteria bacterium MarineAlpha5_Bin11]PPR52209.1 MAG: hypothetical protein CFH20_00114 [Alphaproteobacteria bacterium MarineAlpha5_Bin10]
MEKQIKEILSSTKTIAIVGASSNQAKDSFKVMRYLQNSGYKIIPINPFNPGARILDETVCSDLQEVKLRIDLVNVFRPSNETPVIAEQAAKIGTEALWLQLGITNSEARKIAETANIEFIENKCTMQEHKKIFKK